MFFFCLEFSNYRCPVELIKVVLIIEVFQYSHSGVDIATKTTNCENSKIHVQESGLNVPHKA